MLGRAPSRAFVLAARVAPILGLLVAAPAVLAHGGGGYRGPPPEVRWIAGSVVDAEGAPIPGASVRCDGADPARAGSATAADGTFSLAVPPGAQRVRATAPGYQPRLTSWAVTDDFETTDVGAIALDPGTAIAGRVSARTPFAPDGIRVRLLPEIDPVPEWWCALRAPAGVRPGDDGSFRLEGLPSGAYRVIVSVLDVPGAVEAFQVPAGTDGLDLVLPAALVPQPIAVRVTARTEEGEPVESLRLELSGRSRGRTVRAHGRPASPVVDDCIVAFGLPPFRLEVSAGSDASRRATLTDLVATPAQLALRGAPRHALEGLLREHATQRVVTLREPSVDEPRTQVRRDEPGDETIRGIVTRADGTNVVRAQVRAIRIVPQAEGPVRPLVATARTDIEGRFELKRLLRGSYRLSGRTAGLTSDPYLIQCDTGDEDAVVVVHERPLD